MGTDCSSHLTLNKQYLVDFDSGRKTKVRCAKHEYLNAKRMRNVKVKLKNGKIVLIKDVWYAHCMNSNLMSVCQLLEKGFSITTKDNLLKLYGYNQKLIMQYEPRRNRIFMVNVATSDT